MHFLKQPLSVAVIGSGKIGTDLLIKLLASKSLQASLFIGRNANSEGIKKAQALGVKTSVNGIQALVDFCNDYDLVIDATSAESHRVHAGLLKKLNKPVIDLTPSKIGDFCVPAINDDSLLFVDNINMVTCGGQVAIPIAYAISQLYPDVDYIETVSSIAADSAGLATRHNLNDYIITTESALKHFCKCKETKAIINLNPAFPQVTMKATVYALLSQANEEKVARVVENMVAHMRAYVPGISIVVPPYFDNGKLAVTVEVKGRGDFLPTYAGNLDIITAAAIRVAEKYSQASISLTKAS